jgi:hypothetical protein
MIKLKLTSVDDEKPVRLTVTLPAALHRDLVAYAEILARESGKTVKPARLIAPMLEKFIASDREFARTRRKGIETIRTTRAAEAETAPPLALAPD